MDPLSVLKTLWKNRWVSLTVVVLTLAACAYVYGYAPRNYEAAVVYALAPPDVPSQEQIALNPDLAVLNSDNPYLREQSSLLTQVAIARLSDPGYVEGLEAAGLPTDFTVVALASDRMVSITAESSSQTQAVAMAELLGVDFTRILAEAQQVKGADDAYLYEALLVSGPGPAVEQFSSRLRAVIVTALAGAVVLFAAVSVAQSARLNRSQAQEQSDDGGAKEPRQDQRSEWVAEEPAGGPKRAAQDGTADESGAVAADNAPAEAKDTQMREQIEPRIPRETYIGLG